MTNKMVAAINNFGAQYQLKWECHNAVSFVNAPQQRKNGNDCGAAVNELGRRLLFNEQTVDFPLNSMGSQLRCTQAAEILKFVLSEGVYAVYICEKYKNNTILADKHVTKSKKCF